MPDVDVSALHARPNAECPASQPGNEDAARDRAENESAQVPPSAAPVFIAAPTNATTRGPRPRRAATMRRLAVHSARRTETRYAALFSADANAALFASPTAVNTSTDSLPLPAASSSFEPQSALAHTPSTVVPRVSGADRTQTGAAESMNKTPSQFLSIPPRRTGRNSEDNS